MESPGKYLKTERVSKSVTGGGEKPETPLRVEN
jgi:hypothetical protein